MTGAALAEAPKTPTWKGSILSPILLLTLNLFVFGTMTVYFGNQGEFLVEDENVLLVLLPPAVAFLLLLCAVAYPAWLKNAGVAAATLFFLAFATYLHGNLLRWDTGILDGAALQTGRMLPVAADALVWLVLASLVWRLRGWLARHGWKICVLLMVFQLIGAVELKRSAKVGNRHLQEVPAELYAFHDGPNVIHLVLDGFQGNVFEMLVAEDPQLSSDLDGFVFFRDAMTPSAVTYLSIPATLTGRAYDNSVPITRYHDETLGGHNLYSLLSANGHVVDVASPVWWNLERDYFSSYYRVPAPFASIEETTRNTAWYLLDISLFRQMPYPLKSAIYRKGAWLFSSEMAKHPEQRFEHFAHNALLENLTEHAHAGRQQPTYKLIHLITPHAPLVSEGDCGFAGGERDIGMEAFADQSRCTVKKLRALLEKLRDLGIYDDALVMVHGDHGGGVAFELETPDGGITDSFEAFNGFWGNPLPRVLVKRPGATGPLRISGRPVSLVDLPATVGEVLGLSHGFEGVSVFSDEAPAGRRMYYHSSQHRNDAMEKGRFADFSTFAVDGSMFEVGNWSQLEHFEASAEDLSGDYVPGTPLTFGRTGSFKPFGDGGWTATRNNDINWTQGRESGLLLPLRDPAGEFLLTLTIKPLLVEGKLDRQRMTVMVNGNELETLELKDNRFRTYEIPLPEAVVGNGPVSIRFLLPDAASPLELGSGSDERELAVAFLKAQLDRAD